MGTVALANLLVIDAKAEVVANTEQADLAVLASSVDAAIEKLSVANNEVSAAMARQE